MSIVASIREMLAKGFSVEQALEAAELVEKREEARRVRKRTKEAAQAAAVAAKEEVRREKVREGNAQRQRAWRQRNANNALSHVTSVTPLPKKERVPPAPPLLEKTPSPLSVSNDTLVNGTPSTCELSPQKNNEDVEKLRQFGESWNTLARQLHLPQIDEIKPGSTRQRHALARLRDMTPDGVQGLMTRIRGSPYLRGEVNGFRVSFDWIINPSNYQKIMEGNYEVRKAAPLNGRGRTARVL